MHQNWILGQKDKFPHMHTWIVCPRDRNHIQVLNEQRKNSKTGKIEDEPLLDWENYYNLVSYHPNNYLDCCPD